MLTLGYDDNKNVSSDTYKRNSIRFQNSIRAAKNLEFTASLGYTGSVAMTGKPGWGDISYRANRLFPYARFADDDGNALPMIKDIRQLYADTAGAGKLLDWKYYPLEDYKHTYTKTQLQDVVLNGGVRYTFLHGFSAEVKYQLEKQYTDITKVNDEQSYYTRDLVNRYTQLNRSTQTATYAIPLGAIVNVTNARMTSQGLRGQLGYNHNWNRHSVTVIAGGELRQVNTLNNGYRSYGVNLDILTGTPVDYVNTYPLFTTGSKSNIPFSNDMTEGLNRFVSMFGNAAYTYNGKYTVTLSGRQDASNLFGVKTNN
jgi:hypothetical protein